MLEVSPPFVMVNFSPSPLSRAPVTVEVGREATTTIARWLPPWG